MVDIKVRGVLRVEFLDNYPIQVILANYLRGTGDAKGHVLAATTTYFYPIALAKNTGVSRQDKEMALLDALRNLDNQKKYLIDYYRVHEGIEINIEPFSVTLKSTQNKDPNKDIDPRLDLHLDEDRLPVILNNLAPGIW
jgi:hypothetical protein